VFFATARLTQFMSMLFTQVFHIPTLEIHSRRAQDKRTATSDDFRKQDNVILFSSDVSARGARTAPLVCATLTLWVP
jgi:superfamily II DNA/RNA helicase